MKRLILGLSFLFLASCASGPTQESPEYDGGFSLPPEPQTQSSSSGEPTVDVVALQRALGLDRSLNQLGYKEKAFNTCRVGYGYSSTQNCRNQVMSVINFKLQCRDSEGTVSTALGAGDVRALSHRDIRWTLQNQSGVIATDTEGQGQLVAIFNSSPKTQRLKLATGNEFLYMRAGEINRVVTPQPWCDAR